MHRRIFGVCLCAVYLDDRVLFLSFVGSCVLLWPRVSKMVCAQIECLEKMVFALSIVFDELRYTFFQYVIVSY